MFSISGVGKLDVHLQKNDNRSLFAPVTEINTKCVTGLNANWQILKLLDVNTEAKNIKTKKKKDKWNYRKLRNFCLAKASTKFYNYLQNERNIYT